MTKETTPPPNVLAFPTGAHTPDPYAHIPARPDWRHLPPKGSPPLPPHVAKRFLTPEGFPDWRRLMGPRPPEYTNVMAWQIKRKLEINNALGREPRRRKLRPQPPLTRAWLDAFIERHPSKPSLEQAEAIQRR